MGSQEFLRAVRNSWWVLPLLTVVCALLALAASLSQTPLYTSSTQFFVSATDQRTSTDIYTGSQFTQDRVPAYAQLIGNKDVATQVVDELSLDISPAEVQSKITASVVASTVLIDVHVSDPSPERASAIAGAVAKVFPPYIERLETRGPDGISPISVAVTNSAEVPSVPSSPNTKRNVVIAALLGLILGVGTAVLRARLDRSIKDPEEAAALADAPLLGVLLRDDALTKRPLLAMGHGGRAVEAFRQVRTNLQFLSIDDPPKVIMVTSAVPAEGKSTLIANLAQSLAEADRRVTVIEADLRKPKATRYLGAISGAGLTNVLMGSADVTDVIQRIGGSNLSVIAAGPLPPNPSDLLSSSAMAALLAKLRTDNDFILIDSAPLLPVADSLGLAVHVDGVLLTVAYGQTTKDQLRQASAALDRVGARKLGICLNFVPPNAELASAYGYTYNADYPREDPR